MNWKDNIYFVLIEPRDPGNIGASARAMKNMGFKNLSLVNPPDVITEKERWLAHNSVEILESAQTYNTLAEAVSNKSFVAGTSRRKGKKRGMILHVEEGAKRLAELGRNNRVAVLFGREDRGLYNEEVDECGLLLNIPANPRHPSLNLSHAVMVVAYELAKFQYRKDGTESGSRTPKKSTLVDHGELTALFERMSRVLTLLDYIPRGDRDIEKQITKNIRHFIGRSEITSWELKMLHGICSQIEKKIQ